MNVIIFNQQDNVINDLKIEVIKALQGEFEASQIVDTFSNFFFSRMIIDVTALKDYTSIHTYQKLSIGLPVDKIILLIPSQTEVASNVFLSKLISMGYYNFTTNLDGLEYLLEHPNSYKDVAHIHQIDETPIQVERVNKLILGIKNITEGAGATTLTYMLYKELTENHGINALAIEVNKRDFAFYNDPKMISTSRADLANTLLRNQEHDIVLVDLNDAEGEVCGEVLYLVEPSIIKLNKLIRKDRMIFARLRGKKIVLNKTLISKRDVGDFESEAGTKVFFVMPPVNDRKRQEVILQLLGKLGLIAYIPKKDLD